MYFWRYQSHYEDLEYKDQLVTLVDYMEHYAKNYGKGVFTFTNEWVGFNVPGDVMIEVSNADLPDLNKYDIQMRALTQVAQKEETNHKFYFIGTYREGEGKKKESIEGSLDHELAHALYHVDDEYRELMDGLLDEVPRKNYKTAWSAMQKMRYHPAVCRDEVHAYCTTGPCDELVKVLPLSVRKPFIKAYKEQRKRFKI
jgi:hypothetical protein